MRFDNAKNQFLDNVRLLGKDPEKYNQYNGLANISRGLSDLEDRISNIENTLNEIVRYLRNNN